MVLWFIKFYPTSFIETTVKLSVVEIQCKILILQLNETLVAFFYSVTDSAATYVLIQSCPWARVSLGYLSRTRIAGSESVFIFKLLKCWQHDVKNGCYNLCFCEQCVRVLVSSCLANTYVIILFFFKSLLERSPSLLTFSFYYWAFGFPLLGIAVWPFFKVNCLLLICSSYTLETNTNWLCLGF